MDRSAVIRDCIDRAARLRANGPTTIEYLRWRDGTDELLADLVGAEHVLRLQFREAVGPFDRHDSEGMQIEGEHGMRVRIDRGAELLRQLLGEAD